MRVLLRAIPALIAALLLMAAGPAQSAQAASGQAGSGVDAVAQALRQGPVYVDPRMAGQLGASDAGALAEKIKDADKPVFVAVLPPTSEFPPSTLLRDLRTEVGIAGVYAVRLGDRFDAGADPSVMSRDAVENLTGAVQRNSGGSAEAQLNSFVDQAIQQAGGNAPRSWDGETGTGGAGAGAGAAVMLALLALVVVAGGALVARQRSVQRTEDRAALEELRTVVDEDITAFGEELDRVSFDPSAPSSDDAMRKDFTHALDAYDKAKRLMARARTPQDVRKVTETLEDGRFALATLEARRSGDPLPQRRPPCFFDPRHGISVTDAEWAPPGGTPRRVPVCAADATRIADGEEPMSRTVNTMYGPRPYWEAGPVYAPWASGYFGAGLLPGLLVGTVLGSMIPGPYSPYGYGGDFGEGGGPEGGDYTGGDFDPDDFSGGSGDGGGFGGGDFGGGFDGGFGG